MKTKLLALLLFCTPCFAQIVNPPSGGGGGTVTGTGTTGYFPLWTGTSALGNSPCDAGITAANYITCTYDLAISGPGASQIALIYNATPVVPGSATTAVYGVNSSGQAVISEAGGAPSRACTAGNGACPGSVTSSTLTTNRLPKASGAAALTDSLQTDNGTTLTYTGTGGTVTPGLATNATGTAFYGAAASGVTLTPNSYTNVDVAFTRTAAGTWSCDTTTQSNGICTLIVGQIRNSLMQSSTNATVASQTTIAPTTPLVTISGTSAIATITLPSGFTTGCFDILATGAWTTTTAGNIQAIMTAVPNTGYRACYYGSTWDIK